jgi:hypothetical protein
MPSRDDLQLMYNRRLFITNFSNKTYWSSSQNSNVYAWCVRTDNGAGYIRVKTNGYAVRPIRAFDDTLLPTTKPVLAYPPTATLMPFVAPSPVAVKNGILSLNIKSTVEWLPNTMLLLETFLGTTKTGNAGISPQTRLFGYLSGEDTWQLVALQMTDFAPSMATFDSIRISLVGSWPNNMDLGIDDVRYQIGEIVLPPSTTQLQSDWNQTDVDAMDYIKNKPGSSEEGVLFPVAFEFRDITPGIAQDYYLDLKAIDAGGYTIEGVVLQTDDGTLTGVYIGFSGDVPIYPIADFTIDNVITETASVGAKTVPQGNIVFLTTSTGYTGSPTLIRGHLIIKRTMSAIAIGATSGSPIVVSLVADVDYLYDTGSEVKPKFVQVWDANGVTLGVERYLDSTWRIRILATGTSQEGEINIIY